MVYIFVVDKKRQINTEEILIRRPEMTLLQSRLNSQIQFYDKSWPYPDPIKIKSINDDKT